MNRKSLSGMLKWGILRHMSQATSSRVRQKLMKLRLKEYRPTRYLR